MKTCRLAWPFGIIIVCLTSVAHADDRGWLDWIRDYDLNDYAFGVALTTSQSAYAGAKNSAWAYPMLTSFQHYSLTDDWLVLRGGGVGARAVTSSGWIFGLFGRINTDGLGNGDPEELKGLKDREWSIDVGPFVGWRGWPVHVELDTYVEVTGRHNGYSAELRALLPRNYRWGYLVPSIGVVYASDAFNDYYFGVSEPEVRPGRPLYTAGADMNLRARIEFGYELSDRWLVTGNVTSEWLGDETTSSPIVDRDRVLSATIGLAYNADLFNPREFPYPDYTEPSIGVRVGGFYDNVTTTARRTDPDGIPSDPIDFENRLGSDDAQWVQEAGLHFRIGNYHRFDISYFELGRDSSLIVSDEINFGDLAIPAGAELRVQSDFSSIVTTYSYSLMKDAQKELGLTAGLHFTSFESRIDVVDGDSEAIDGAVTLPVFGAHGSVALGEKTRLAARLQLFVSDLDRYEGNMYYGTLDLTRQVTRQLRLGIGVNLYDLRLTSSKNSIRGEFETRHFGPVLFLGAEF